MMLNNLNLLQGKQHGLAALEMIIILPVFLLLIGGTIEVGRVYYQYTELDKMQKSAAFFLSRILEDNGNGQADIISENAASHVTDAKNLLVYAGGDTPLLPGLTVNDVSITTLNDYQILVSTTYQYQPLGAFNFNIINPVNLVASAVVRITE